MSLKALWKPLPLKGVESLARSSHGLVSTSDSEILIFGGELKPRTPVEGDLIRIENLDSSPEISTLSKSSESQSWPSSRVGASFVNTRGGKVYLWGGRGGREMGTFTSEKGIWEYDAQGTKEWRELETKGDSPEPRSFHTMCAVDTTLFLHAGCPASGRLGQLHSLDLKTLEWSRLPDAPGAGRGGTVLTSLPPLNGNSFLARFGGFAGHELDGLDIYDVGKKEWKSVEVEGESKPEKRSVYVFVGLDGKLEHDGKSVVGVLALGEREGAPAELGHNGAGFFHNDAWALLSTKDEASPRYSWSKLESSSKSEGIPEARGWLPAAHLSGSKVVFQGGLNEKNERLSDAWTLEVVVE